MNALRLAAGLIRGVGTRFDISRSQSTLLRPPSKQVIHHHGGQVASHLPVPEEQVARRQEPEGPGELGRAVCATRARQDAAALHVQLSAHSTTGDDSTAIVFASALRPRRSPCLPARSSPTRVVSGLPWRALPAAAYNIHLPTPTRTLSPHPLPPPKPQLGGKGANLCEMARLGVNIPAGFTITTEVCQEFYRVGEYSHSAEPRCCAASRLCCGLLGAG